ncbi:non-ribosomal peptide synthetase, partial [Streptomyces sp. NPDC059169]
MTTSMDTGRGFWRGVVGVGGFTVVPRWSVGGVSGVGGCEVGVSDGVVEGLRGLVREWGVGWEAVWLAAHARVLAVLSGEDEVVTGVVVEGGVLPCRVVVGEGSSWVDVVGAADRAWVGVCAHRGVPVVGVGGEEGPWFETVLDVGGGRVAGAGVGVVGGVGEGVVWRVEPVWRGGRVVVRAGFDTAVVDAGAAARWAGYYAAALGEMAAGGRVRGAGGLVSADEVDEQLSMGSGPVVELPDVRVH